MAILLPAHHESFLLFTQIKLRQHFERKDPAARRPLISP